MVTTVNLVKLENSIYFKKSNHLHFYREQSVDTFTLIQLIPLISNKLIDVIPC